MLVYVFVVCLGSSQLYNNNATQPSVLLARRTATPTDATYLWKAIQEEYRQIYQFDTETDDFGCVYFKQGTTQIARSYGQNRPQFRYIGNQGKEKNLIATRCSLVNSFEDAMTMLTSNLEASHTCHEKQCVNAQHIVMEASTTNRERNQCGPVGNGMCVLNHNPPCLKAGCNYHPGKSSQVVSDTKNLTCSNCKKEFSTRSSLIRHLKVLNCKLNGDTKLQDTKKGWDQECASCGALFMTRWNLNQHTTTLGKHSKTEFYCKHCDRSFRSHRVRTNHEKNMCTNQSH